MIFMISVRRNIFVIVNIIRILFFFSSSSSSSSSSFFSVILLLLLVLSLLLLLLSLIICLLTEGISLHSTNPSMQFDFLSFFCVYVNFLLSTNFKGAKMSESLSVVAFIKIKMKLNYFHVLKCTTFNLIWSEKEIMAVYTRRQEISLFTINSVTIYVQKGK